MSPPLVALQNLTIARGTTPILREIDWTIHHGEYWVVTGANGAGKSTLVEALTGRHRRLAGSRSWPGLRDGVAGSIRLISFTDTGRLFHNANAVHYYQQRFNAFDADGHLTAGQYLIANGHTSASARAALRKLGAGELFDRERIKLSSGQTRKLLLAKALAGQPQVLVIDNPYLGLDAGSRSSLNQLLEGLVATTGITLILSGQFSHLPECITHRLHLVAGHVDSATTIASGELLPASPPLDEVALSKIGLYFRSREHSLRCQSVIRLEKVSIAYGEEVVFDDFSWTVRPGEKWVVSGANGSGKSTLLSLIYADHPQAYANRVYLFDHRRGRGESIWEVKRRIGFTSPELHTFFAGQLTAREVVLSGLTDSFRPPKRPALEASRLLDALFAYAGLATRKEAIFNHFSTGEQRLLLLLRALIKAPPVLLLDEPFQGMDAVIVNRCQQLLSAIMTPERTVVFISHFREEVPEGVNLELRLGGIDTER
ncbi:MAG: ATP-binding cassette domain-containing protein [Bacteroidota bacterium]